MVLEKGRLMLNTKAIESEDLNVSVESGVLYFMDYGGLAMMRKVFLPRPSEIWSTQTTYEGHRHHVLSKFPQLRESENPVKEWHEILKYLPLGEGESKGYTLVRGDVVETRSRIERDTTEDEESKEGDKFSLRHKTKNTALIYKEKRRYVCPMAYADLLTSADVILDSILQDKDWAAIEGEVALAFLRATLEKMGEIKAKDLVKSDLVGRIHNFWRLAELLRYSRLWLRGLWLTPMGGYAASVRDTDTAVAALDTQAKNDPVWKKWEEKTVNDVVSGTLHTPNETIDNVDLIATSILSLTALEQELATFLSELQKDTYVLRNAENLEYLLDDVNKFLLRLIALEEILKAIPELHQLYWSPKYDFMRIEPTGGFRVYSLYPEIQRLWYVVDQPRKDGWNAEDALGGAKPQEKYKAEYEANLWWMFEDVAELKNWPVIQIHPMAVKVPRVESGEKADKSIYSTAKEEHMVMEYYTTDLVDARVFKRFNSLRQMTTSRTMRLSKAYNPVEEPWMADAKFTAGIENLSKKGQLFISQRIISGTLETDGFESEQLVDMTESTPELEWTGTLMIPGGLNMYPRPRAAKHPTIADRYLDLNDKLYIVYGDNIHTKLRKVADRIDTYNVAWRYE